MSLITANNVTLAYDGTEVVQNLSFTIEQGDYVCIIGENGSGKSTLTKALLGLMSPTGGSVEYGEGLKRKEIGYLPQQTEVQKDFPASVYEIVLSGCHNALGKLPFYKSSHKKRAMAALKRLDIENIKNTCYHRLSGGQQQRVLLARALCATDRLLILDEPASGLDPVITAQFYEIINDLNKKENITVIMVSHDGRAVLEYSSKILHLTHDSYIFTTKQEYKNTSFGKNFLGGDVK